MTEELGSQTQLVRELFNGVEDRLENIKKIQDKGFGDINAHLKELNGKVAKNSGWIDRYDIRVADDLPEYIDKTDKINTEMKQSINELKIVIARWGGIGFGITFLLTIALRFVKF